jgi:hypothetical protein
VSAELADLYVFSRLREGTYTAGPKRIYFQDASTIRDAADLYAVLKEQAANGSPNLENELVKAFIQTMQNGQTLSGEQLAKLFELRDRYAAEIEAYRKDPDWSQDILKTPDERDAARARILN